MIENTVHGVGEGGGGGGGGGTQLIIEEVQRVTKISIHEDINVVQD